MKSSLSSLCLMVAVGTALAGCGDDSPAPTYTVGGTVSGLAGTGLVLTNGTTTVGVSSNGSFTLAGRFNAGASYGLSVGTQPTAPAQVCTVSNGSGTVNANVTNIAVNCLTTPMTVASSTPADGATAVARTAQPTVTFSVPVNAGSVGSHVTFKRGTRTVPASFSAAGTTLTVEPTMPLSLLTTYTVAADTGLLGTNGEALADNLAVSFTTRDGEWHPVETARSAAFVASGVKVALTPDGNAIAAWQESNSGHTNVWASFHTVGTGWGTPFLLESDTQDATQVQVAVDGQGNAYVVWAQYDGARSDIWMNHYTAGTGWSGATQISSPGLGIDNFSPKVAANAAGDVVFAWVNQANSDYAVWARILPAGGTLGSVTRIESATGITGDVQVVMDPAGNATVVWLNADNNVVDLWANHHGTSGWEAGSIIENSSQNLQEYSLGVGLNGEVRVAWTQQVTNSTMGVYTSRYGSGTGWSAPTTLAITTDGSAYYPKVAGDADGNALVIWGQLDGSTFNAYSSYSTAGGSWGAPVLTPLAIGAEIAFDRSGNALALWSSELNPSNNVIKASRFTPVGGFAAPVVVTPSPTAYAQYPNFAIDAYGRALAVWIDYEILSNSSGVSGSRFDDSPIQSNN